MLLRDAGRMVRGAVLVVCASLALAGCGVVYDAPDVTILVQEQGIVYNHPDDVHRLVGGETVLHVENDSGAHRQVVLARLGDRTTIPPELLEAESPRDDGRIVRMSHVMDPKESTFESGGFGYKIDSASFHVYLAPGERYAVFDRLSGLDDRMILTFVPGPQPGGRA